MFDDENQKYSVVINHEEQYSLWPEGRETPLGWRVVREPAPRQESLDYIDKVWTQMRPLSLRAAMAAAEKASGDKKE